jgi:CHAD domain-containing protein
VASVPRDPADEAALHAYRLLVKRVRYALEPVAGAFAPGLRDRVYGELKSLQDRLGAINDHVVAADLFRAWAVHTRDAAEVAALHRLADLEDAEREVTRELFHSWWAEERQQRLRRDLEAVTGRSLPADPVRPAADGHRTARLRESSRRPDRDPPPPARSIRTIR